MHITTPHALPCQPRPVTHTDISSFVQLRSLMILCDTDEQQANQLCTQPFEHLSYLHLASFANNVMKGSYQSLMEKIFSNGFPALRVCHLPQAMRPRHINTPSSPAISVISLAKSTFTVLAEIVRCVPNATHLTVKDLADVSKLPSSFFLDIIGKAMWTS